MPRTLGFVTSARSDFGLLLPLIRAAAEAPGLGVLVYATGMHFSRRHGHSLDEILAAGLEPVLVPVGVSGDEQRAMALAIGAGVTAFAGALCERRPDLLVAMGDRYDMMPAVLAALPLRIPVAHLAGGELTEGVIDDAIRHAVTKMSHLHFPTLPDYATRLMRLGEEPWRITVTGEPGLDALVGLRFEARETVLGALGLDPGAPVCVFTLHPETLPETAPEAQPAAASGRLAGEALAAAAGMPVQLVLSYPNADAGSEAIIAAIEGFAAGRPGCRVVPHLGRDRYLQLLHHAACMVGNSSSGLVEAASFQLPVVDIGRRQGGRLAPRNVLRAPPERTAIAAAWRQALSPAFRAGLAGLANPYGDGHAVPRILSRLATQPLGPELLVKRFYQGPAEPPAAHGLSQNSVTSSGSGDSR
jgi:UDP-N-acetylglucosamine 2-epimerase (non-hydrolysing)